MQQENYKAAEAVYMKAQIIDPDVNKACNLSLCLMKQSRDSEAKLVLQQVLQDNKIAGSNDDPKSRKRAEELMMELEQSQSENKLLELRIEDEFIIEGLDEFVMNQWSPLRSRRLPIFEEISQFRDQLAC